MRSKLRVFGHFMGLPIAFLFQASAIAMPQLKLLTDPFLQLPTQDSVRVVWFTEFPGRQHHVQYGENLEKTAIATTTKLSKVREDQPSDAKQPQSVIDRNIWRHEAIVTDLPAQKIPYRVHSIHETGETITSDRFSLSPLPTAGTPQKILLTSDHQLRPMTPANLQKVVETVGSVDAVFFAGDLVNIPDQASEWFDQGNGFFPSLQGKANFAIGSTTYTGGAIIQSAPLFPSVGNHEVMGRFSAKKSLKEQYQDPIPRKVAQERYAKRADQINPRNDKTVELTWIKNNSFNTDTYQEIFSLPSDGPGGEQYYAITVGDVRLISLYLTRIWRSPNPPSGNRYQEKTEDLNAPEQWGYGQHIFEAIAPGSPQYEWLKAELQRPEFQEAKYRVIMFHHPPHSLGKNVVPAFTDPVRNITRDLDGSILSIQYDYPKNQDYLIRDVIPLLEAAETHLVLYGHTHIWNRFMSDSGLHFLETSNVGNTFGVYTQENGEERPIPYTSPDYVATGNPNGLPPILPTIAPLTDPSGKPQPYISSNEITVFSILDTAQGTVSSYRFNTHQPNAQVVKFDEFNLRGLTHPSPK